MYKCVICGKFATKERDGRPVCNTHYRWYYASYASNGYAQIAYTHAGYGPDDYIKVEKMANVTELPQLAKRIKEESKRFDRLMREKQLSELTEVEKMEIRYYEKEVQELADSLAQLGVPKFSLQHLYKPLEQIRRLMDEAGKVPK